MSAQIARLRRDRRMRMHAVRSWHEWADRIGVMTLQSCALKSRHVARKAVTAIRCWFYRVSCVRGAMSTRKRTMRRFLQRTMRFWRLHASSTRLAAAAMSKTAKIAKTKNIFGAWHLAITESEEFAAAWAVVVGHICTRLRKEHMSAECMRLCCTWKASALFKKFAARCSQAQRGFMLDCWREKAREAAKVSEVANRFVQDDHVHQLNTVVSKWKNWVDANGAQGCQVVGLNARLKRTRLSAFCQAWNRQARLSAAKFRVEVAFGVWHTHACLQASILSNIYKRGASRARRLAAICLHAWARRSRCSSIGRHAVQSLYHRLLFETTRSWVAHMKLLQWHRVILIKTVALIRIKVLRSATYLWRNVVKRSAALQTVRALVRVRIMSHAVDEWLSWKGKTQRIKRVCESKQMQNLTVKARVMILYWLHYTSYKVCLAKVLKSVGRKLCFRLLRACLEGWASHSSTALYYASSCRWIQDTGTQNRLFYFFRCMAKATQRSKRLCAIQVLILRSTIAATCARSWRQWCAHVQTENDVRSFIHDRHLRACKNILIVWAALAHDSLHLFQGFWTLDRKLRVLRLRSTLHLWHYNVRCLIIVQHKCCSMRIQQEYRLKREFFKSWPQIEAPLQIPAPNTDVSSFDRSSYFLRLAHAHQRDARKKTCTQVFYQWEEIIKSKISLGFILKHLDRRRGDRALMLVFYHWSLTFVVQNQRWSAFERMRYRRAQSRLANALDLWKDVHAHHHDVVLKEAQNSARLAKKVQSCLCHRQILLATNTLRLWKVFSFSQQQICAEVTMKRALNEERKVVWLQHNVLVLWRQHAEIIQTLLRAIDFGLRNKVTELVSHCFELWVLSLSDSIKCTGTVRLSSVDSLVKGYIKAKLRALGTRLLQVCLTIWTARMVRKKVLEDWTVNFYSRKRLDRIERQVYGQHLMHLLRLAFHTIGQFVQEKCKFQQQFGELRSRFACTSALVPASPSVTGESF